MDFVNQNGNGYHTPEESDVDGVSPSSIKTVSKDVSLDSLSIESRGRNSLTPERAPGTSSNTGTLEKDPTKSRLKQRLRHMSSDKDKKILHPPITAPLTKEKIEDFSEFLRQNSYKTADIVKILNDCPWDPEEVVEKDSGKRAIHVVSCLDDHRLCDALLQTGHKPTCQTLHGHTPLHLAIYKENQKTVKSLLNSNSDILGQTDFNGNAPIHFATMVLNREVLKMLKYKQVDFKVCNHSNASPLHMATNLYRKEFMKDDIDLDRIMKIEEMINEIISYLGPDELTKVLQVKVAFEHPLHVFAAFNNIEILEKICKKVNDASVFETLNSDELTPFMVCLTKIIESKHQGVKMDDYEADKSVKEQNKRNNLPMKKKRRRSTKLNQEPDLKELALSCAKILLPKMTDNTINNTYNQFKNLTALQIILRNVKLYDKSSEVDRYLVYLLLQKGADVDLNKSMIEEEPINIVTSRNYDKDILVLFIDHLREDTIDFQDDCGDTVLHHAVGLNDEELIVKILEKKANVMIKNHSEVLSDLDIHTKPNMKISGNLQPRIPLLIALQNTLKDTCSTYFHALHRVGISNVICNVKCEDLLEFFIVHLVAAAFVSDNQAVRELCKLLTSKAWMTTLTSSCKKSEEKIISEVIHFSKDDHFEKTFHKTALAWTNENDDPISASDLLHLEYRSHTSKSDGLSCMKKQLTNDKLLYWMTRTYSKFYPTPNLTLWITAITVSFFQLGISYFFYIFDIYSDYQLTTDYAAAYTDVHNYTLLMLECAKVNQTLDGHLQNSTCFQTGDRYPQTTYKVAFILTWISMIISLCVYVVGIIFFFDSKNVLQTRFNWLYDTKNNKMKLEKQDSMYDEEDDELRGSHDRKLLNNYYIKEAVKILLICLVKLLWPFFHLYRRIRYEASRNKSKRRNNFIEFESIWVMVKTIEYGIEATCQLIIVLYLLVPYYDEIHIWDFETSTKKIFSGIAHFASGGKYQACLLEKVLGKLFINVVAQSWSLTFLKYMKYGMSVFEHLSHIVPLYLSYASQIVARIMVLRVFFVTAEELFHIDNKGLSIGIFFILHFCFTLIIKLLFEGRTDRITSRRMDFKCLQLLVKFLINWISSSTVYIWCTGYGANPRRHIHEHNTFLPQLSFQILILIEHLILTVFSLSLSNTICLDTHVFEETAVAAVCLWIFGNMSLVFHYKNCHTWSQTNGPTQNFCGEANKPQVDFEEEENQENYKDSDLLCYCISNLCCSRNPYKISVTKACIQIETLDQGKGANSISCISNGIEMKSSCEPLLSFSSS